MGHILVFQFLCFCNFGRFDIFGFQLYSCVLRVIVRYDVTNGIILVVGRVTEGVCGGLGGLGVQCVISDDVDHQRRTMSSLH